MPVLTWNAGNVRRSSSMMNLKLAISANLKEKAVSEHHEKFQLEFYKKLIETLEKTNAVLEKISVKESGKNLDVKESPPEHSGFKKKAKKKDEQ